jgi:hypothetical protein
MDRTRRAATAAKPRVVSHAQATRYGRRRRARTGTGNETVDLREYVPQSPAASNEARETKRSTEWPPDGSQPAVGLRPAPRTTSPQPPV